MYSFARAAGTKCHKPDTAWHRQRKELSQSGMVVHTWIPSTWQAEAGALQALDQPGLYREILFQRKKESVIAVIYHHAQHRFFFFTSKKTISK